MKSDSNEPVHLSGTAKTHKFENLEDIIVVNLKFRPVIIRLECSHTIRLKLYQIILDLYVKMNIPLMIHKDFQAFHFHFYLCNIMRKMYYMMSTRYLQIFQ